MPVEIKELVIRAVVDPKGERPSPSAPSSLPAEERQAIVEAAVQEVLRVLKLSKER